MQEQIIYYGGVNDETGKSWVPGGLCTKVKFIWFDNNDDLYEYKADLSFEMKAWNNEGMLILKFRPWKAFQIFYKTGNTLYFRFPKKLRRKKQKVR